MIEVAQCLVCSGMFSSRADGTLRIHGPCAMRCPGSRQHPRGTLLWVSTANPDKAMARLRTELSSDTDRWPDKTSVEDVRAVLDEVVRLRGQIEDYRTRVNRRTDKIIELRNELTELRGG